MFKIEENCLYAISELDGLLPGRMTVPTLLDRLNLRKQRVFKDAVWGFEIIEAARLAKPFSELGDGATAAVLDATPGNANRAGREKAPVRRLTTSDLEGD